MATTSRNIAQIVTGTVTGNGTSRMSLACPFEPDVGYIRRIAPFDALTERIAGGVIVWKNIGDAIYQVNANGTVATAYAGNFLPTGSELTDLPYVHSKYANGNFEFASVSTRYFSADATYEYCFIKFT